MFDINKMAHTSILNEPNDFDCLMSLSCDMYPINGPIVTPMSNANINLKFFLYKSTKTFELIL